MSLYSTSSTFLTEGYLGKLTTLPTLQHRCRFSNAQAARSCCVSVETYRRWLTDRKPNPTAVRLMAILAGYVPWQGWDGWEMHRGYLLPPGYTRHGVSPGDWVALVFLKQLVSEQERQITALKAQLKSQADRASRSA